MNSTTSLVARQYRLQQWAEQIQDCQNRSAEVSVRDWCSLHEITVANYYYRLREVRKACLERISQDSVSQSIVPVPSQLMQEEAYTGPTSGLKVSVNHICIHVTSETSPELLKMVLQVAADVK